jgi:DNA-binding MurR/RpiR family transcriptional regulator
MTDETDPARPIYQRIDEIYPRLAPQSRRVADTVLEHLGDLGTYSVAELGELSGTSIATVSRLFASIGFDDYASVKAHARTLRQEGIPIADLDAGGDSEERFQREVENLRAVYRLAASGEIDKVSEIIASAGQVAILGFRNSFPIATHLRASLLQARTRVALVPHAGQSMGEELATIGAGDAVLVVGFRRRLSQFDDLMRFLSTTGATVVLLADSTARRHTVWANIWLDCPIDAEGAFDSYAAPMSLVSLIAESVLEKCGSRGRRNVVRIATAHESLNELDGEDLGYRRSASPPGQRKS